MEALTIGFLVKCKCGFAARLDVPAVRKTQPRYTKGVIGVPGTAERLADRVWREPIFERESYASHVVAGFARCWACSRTLRATQITGRKTEHVCGAKCLASKGPLCECSCGGKNHGNAYT